MAESASRPAGLHAAGARPAEWPEYLVRLDEHLTRCTGDTCAAWCRWGLTRKGKKILMEADPNPETGKLECHWITCPDAQAFRR